MKLGKGEKAVAVMAALGVLTLALAGVVSATDTETAMSEVIDLMWLFIPLIFVFALLGGLMGMMTGVFAFGRR